MDHDISYHLLLHLFWIRCTRLYGSSKKLMCMFLCGRQARERKQTKKKRNKERRQVKRGNDEVWGPTLTPGSVRGALKESYFHETMRLYFQHPLWTRVYPFPPGHMRISGFGQEESRAGSGLLEKCWKMIAVSFPTLSSSATSLSPCTSKTFKKWHKFSDVIHKKHWAKTAFIGRTLSICVDQASWCVAPELFGWRNAPAVCSLLT